MAAVDNTEQPSGLTDAAAAGGLQRVLRAPALFATAYGDVGSSIYYALGLVAAAALGLTPLVFLISGVIFILTALTYAEGTSNFPEAGGASSFARHSFNESVSFGAAWSQTLNYLITIAISAFSVPHYLSVFWRPLNGGPHHWDVIVTIALIIGLCALNVVGVRETTRLNIVLAIADFVKVVLLVIIGAVLVLNPSLLIHQVHFGVAPTLPHFFTSIAIAMIAYTGLETMSNLAEETRAPTREVPRAMLYLVIAVLAIYLTLPAVTLSALPVHHTAHGYATQLGTTYAANPVLGLAQNLPLHVAWIKQGIAYVVSALAAAVLLTAANAGIIGVSRLTYSMGQHRQVPQVLRRLHQRFYTPAIAIALYGFLACIILLPALHGHSATGEVKLLANLYAFGAMLSFSIAHVCIIGIRWKRTELVWRAPFNVRAFGRSLPMFAILGLIGTGFAYCTQLVLHPTERWIGLGWLAFGLIGYVLFRRSSGLPLTKTVLAPVLLTERAPQVSFRSVMVPLLGKLDLRAMVIAARLANSRNASVYVLAPLEVPLSLPLNADMRAADIALNAQLDRAAQLAGDLGVHVVTRIQRTRNAVRAILEEATLREAQAIVVTSEPSRFSHPRMRVLSNTIDRIIRRANTRVLLLAPRRDGGWRINDAMDEAAAAHEDAGSPSGAGAR